MGASPHSPDGETGLSAAYAGRILRVDLGTGRTEILPTERYARRYLGGRGIATAIHWEQSPPDAPFSDGRNPLILAVGPLSGSPGGLGGSRWGIYGKSPLPAAAHGGRDHLCQGNLGGRFGAELRYAGYDAVVIVGVADEPVSLSIEDDEVRVEPAGDLWGLETVEAMERLLARSAPKSKAMAIGPAGENLVPLAIVFADGDASCSGGMGALMGSKKLKAVTVRGSQRRVPVARPDELKAIGRQIASYQRGNVKVWGLDFMAHGPKTKKSPCYGCMAHCLRVRYRAEDGSSGKFMCQARFFYMDHAWGYHGQDNDVPFHANRLCDRYGLDTWEVQTLIEWLLRCHDEGLISEAESGLDLSKVGSLEFIEDLVRLTALRQGFGEMLASGALAAARQRGGAAEAIFTRNDPYDPRYCTVNTLLFPFETREPIQQLHEAGLVLSQWSSWAKGVPEAHISSDVLRGIAARFWGSERAGDMTTLEGKAEAARRIQDRQLAKECLGVCDWMFPLIDIPVGEDHVGDPAIESRILSAVLGQEVSEQALRRVGERVFNLQRAVLLREGHRAGQDDVLPDEWHEQRIQTHVADPDLLAPGQGGEVISQLGRRIGMASYLGLRDEFYRLRGWDMPTGLPAVETLAALEMDDVAEDLTSRGLTVQRARALPVGARLRRGLDIWLERRRDRRAEAARLRNKESRGEPVQGEALMAILITEQGKFGDERVRHNFRGWNKIMQYSFPDLGEHYAIRFVDGQASIPEWLPEALPAPDISYEMESWVLAAMSAGELSGKQAYLKRLLRIKAAFGDMMKLQSLNKI